MEESRDPMLPGVRILRGRSTQSIKLVYFKILPCSRSPCGRDEPVKPPSGVNQTSCSINTKCNESNAVKAASVIYVRTLDTPSYDNMENPRSGQSRSPKQQRSKNGSIYRSTWGALLNPSVSADFKSSSFICLRPSLDVE